MAREIVGTVSQWASRRDGEASTICPKHFFLSFGRNLLVPVLEMTKNSAALRNQSPGTVITVYIHTFTFLLLD